MLAKDFFRSEDSDYIIGIRRELHMHPEIGFDLPNTVALVKRELEKIGVEYTEKYGRSSIVATINDSCEKFTIGIRADMDALPIKETNDIPYKSLNDGKMHACGHDAHTAMLLGTARALKRAEKKLNCRIKLLFQACEEGTVAGSGAELMVADGVMDDIDIIIGMHVENWLDSGCIGVCSGPSMAASNPIDIEFFGRAAHATLPQAGNDALAMAVKTYNNIQIMLAREIDPFAKYVCSISALNAGHTNNVIADYSRMKLSLRTYDVELNNFIEGRIKMIANNAADELGGTVKIKGGIRSYPIINNPIISEKVIEAAKKVVGENNIVPMPPKMSSEDFSHYMTKKPGVFFRLGTRNEEKGCNTLPHNNDFMIDEDAFISGSLTCVQFVLDNMNGISNL